MLSGSVLLEVQGSVFKAAVSGMARGGGPGGRRGRINGFSAAARKRLLQRAARLLQEVMPLFITLTMADVVEPAEMKHFLRVLWKRIERAYPRAAVMWRFAMESSGERVYHPHFHLLLYGVPFLPVEWLAQTWAEVTGQAGGYCWVEKWSRKKAAWYLARYTSKADEAASLDYLAYLTGERWTGRCWGMYNAKMLPWAVLQVVKISLGGWFYDLKRSARRVYKGVNDNRWAGFMLFRDDTDAWLNLAWFYCFQEVHG